MKIKVFHFCNKGLREQASKMIIVQKISCGINYVSNLRLTFELWAKLRKIDRNGITHTIMVGTGPDFEICGLCHIFFRRSDIRLAISVTYRL